MRLSTLQHLVVQLHHCSACGREALSQWPVSLKLPPLAEAGHVDRTSPVDIVLSTPALSSG